MRDAVVAALRERFGDGWATDEEANLRFSADAEALLQRIDGIHLLGDAEFADGEVTLRVWVDRPVPDLMTADELAFAVFGRLAEEVFLHGTPVRAGGAPLPVRHGDAPPRSRGGARHDGPVRRPILPTASATGSPAASATTPDDMIRRSPNARDRHDPERCRR
jgi:hypothetical protein